MTGNIRVWRHRQYSAAVFAAATVVLLAIIGPEVQAGASEVATQQAAQSATQPPPLERFAALPLLSQVTLSPDGQKLAMLMNRGGLTYLVTRATASDDAPKALLHSDNKEYYFNWIRWVNNDRIVVSLRFASRRNFVGTTETRLLSIQAEGGGVVNLVRADSVSGSVRRDTVVRQIQDQVIDWLPTDGQHLLLALADPGSDAPAVYKVNVNTGQRTIVKAPERHVQWWVTDAQGRVRVGVRREDGTYQVRVVSADGKEWRTLWTFSRGQDEVWPLGFGLDPNELYVLAAHEGRRAVFSVRLDDASLTKTLRFAHPTQDVQGALLRSPVTQEVIGLRRNPDDDESGRTRAELWAPIWRTQMQAIDAGLPQRDNLLIDISRDGQLYLISSESSRQPREFYIGDRRTGRVALLGGTYPDLDVTLLAGKWRQTIKARDGLELDIFLALPVGRSLGDGGVPLPLVLLPHGGPQLADGAAFDTWTEFLASRGYAVLQVNFRGSGGYGYNFRAAGLKRWGLEMQDDLADGVAWAVSRGVADPARVCIVGASYGGYAALMGVVKTPELYRCAVSFAGVSDLPDQIRYWGNYIGGDEWGEELIGRLWGDRERLQATSPARQAERIRVPVLLVHGTVDRAVPIEQSEAMVKALKRAGKIYRYIEQEGGDHYLSRYEHRLEFFKAMESFLDENLRAPAAQVSPGL